MKILFCNLLCLCINFLVNCELVEKKFKRCDALENLKSSFNFMKIEKLDSARSCAILCSHTNPCDILTYSSSDFTCTLYRTREMLFINEFVPSTHLYLYHTGNSCPPNWYHFAPEASCYYVSNTLKTWDDAVTYCWEEMGGHLTNVNNQNEQDFLIQLLQNTVNADAWIGISKESGQFQWTSDLDFGPQNIVYYAWAPLEPYLNAGAVKMWTRHGFKWDDSPTYMTYNFICKKPEMTVC